MSSPHPPVSGGPSTAGQSNPINSNYVSLCRLGQETVQEVVTKTMELFQLLKSTQLPTDGPQQTFAEKKSKMDDYCKVILARIKAVHVMYDKLNEYCTTLDTTTQDKVATVQAVTEEHEETLEQVRLKNTQLKEIIDHLRTVIWEINTMIAMRKTVIT